MWRLAGRALRVEALMLEIAVPMVGGLKEAGGWRARGGRPKAVEPHVASWGAKDSRA